MFCTRSKRAFTHTQPKQNRFHLHAWRARVCSIRLSSVNSKALLFVGSLRSRWSGANARCVHEQFKLFVNYSFLIKYYFGDAIARRARQCFNIFHIRKIVFHNNSHGRQANQTCINISDLSNAVKRVFHNFHQNSSWWRRRHLFVDNNNFAKEKSKSFFFSFRMKLFRINEM